MFAPMVLAPTVLAPTVLALVTASGGIPPWTWPVTGPVVAAFAPPLTEYGPGHRGVDIAAPPGTPVRAAHAGTVHFAGRVAGVPVVSIRSDETPTLRSTYQPVTAAVTAGARVESGDVIGHLAPSECRCLHLGAKTPGGYLDPQGLLGQRQVLKSPRLP